MQPHRSLPENGVHRKPQPWPRPTRGLLATGGCKVITVPGQARSGPIASATPSPKDGADATAAVVTATRSVDDSTDAPSASTDNATATSTTPATTATSTTPATTATSPTPATTASAPADNAWRWEESDDAVLAYGTLVGLLALGTLPVLHGTKLADMPYFVGLAVVTIYIGAHRGLTSRQRQQISLKEGALAPVLASVSLFGFYLLIKYLPDFNLKAFLNAYFWLLGSFAIGGAAVPVLRRVGGELGQLSLKYDIPEGFLLDEKGESITKAELAPTDIAAVALALGLSTAELASGHSNFTLNNLVATLVATDILQLIGPRSFRTAGLLLVGLLLYDVFWVFGSPKVVGDNVMLAVATSDMISGPTRILFPRIPGGGSTAEAAAAAFPYSLLGLGDIAIPGLLACLALRYDASRSTDMRARAVAAASAITSALASLQPGATSRQVAETTANAAEAAYNRVADQEARQRTESLDGASSSGRASGGAGKPEIGARQALAAAVSTSSQTDGGQENQQQQQEQQGDQQQRLPVSEAVMCQRTFFTPVLFAYVAGLAAAFVANDVTGLGQPALLYIVPATLGAVVLTAVQRGELGRVWSFTDVPSYGLPVKEGKESDGSDHRAK